jgi:hypothetical protein
MVPLVIGGVIALPIAVVILTHVEPRAFRIAFGAFLMIYSLYMLARPTLAVLRPTGSAAVNSLVGFGGGLVGGLTAMPGALLAIWCESRGLQKERQRAIVQPFTMVMQIVAVLLLAFSSGTINGDLLNNIALSFPALITGTLIGMALFGRVDERRFRLAILMVLFVSGALMIR